MKFDLFKTRLTEIFREAARAAEAADPGEGNDGGTCNLDSPAFRIRLSRENVIRSAAKAAGIDVSKFRWFNSQWYWLDVPLRGQANRRSTMMEAAQKVLNAVEDVPGWKALGYYQAD